MSYKLNTKNISDLKDIYPGKVSLLAYEYLLNLDKACQIGSFAEELIKD